jgi:D-tyrosyl-tRNA(Tyr) deacylase
MRAVVQRVRSARVTVEAEEVGVIGRGILMLVCAMADDGPQDPVWLADKLLALRLFADSHGRTNESVQDLANAARIQGTPPPGILLVPQFTLAADLSPGRARGNRPAFVRAAPPALARVAFDGFVEQVQQRAEGIAVATGRFGADMQVALVNDGPFTLWLDTRSGEAAFGGAPGARP